MGKLSFVFDKADQVQAAKVRIFDLAVKGLQAGRVVLTLGRESRTDKQNRWFHALIGEIKRQIKLDQDYSLEIWKAFLVDQFEQELLSEGRKLEKPSRFVMSLDKQRIISIRASTKDFSAPLAGEFISFLYAYGVTNGVDFSANAKRIYQDHGAK